MKNLKIGVLFLLMSLCIFASDPWRTKITKDDGVQAKVIRSQSKLTISYHGKSMSTTIMPFNGDDQNVQKGPIPVGLYLIDEQRVNHDVPWFNLHQLKKDKSGFYGYNGGVSQNGTPRTNFGIHKALSVTWGCVSAYNIEQVSAWLNKGEVIYNGQKFLGFLTVVQ